jgi:hypothetical protein
MSSCFHLKPINVSIPHQTTLSSSSSESRMLSKHRLSRQRPNDRPTGQTALKVNSSSRHQQQSPFVLCMSALQGWRCCIGQGCQKTNVQVLFDPLFGQFPSFLTPLTKPTHKQRVPTCMWIGFVGGEKRYQCNVRLTIWHLATLYWKEDDDILFYCELRR